MLLKAFASVVSWLSKTYKCGKRLIFAHIQSNIFYSVFASGESLSVVRWLEQNYRNNTKNIFVQTEIS